MREEEWISRTVSERSLSELAEHVENILKDAFPRTAQVQVIKECDNYYTAFLVYKL